MKQNYINQSLKPINSDAKHNRSLLPEQRAKTRTMHQQLEPAVT